MKQFLISIILFLITAFFGCRSTAPPLVLESITARIDTVIVHKSDTLRFEREFTTDTVVVESERVKTVFVRDTVTKHIRGFVVAKPDTVRIEKTTVVYKPRDALPNMNISVPANDAPSRWRWLIYVGSAIGVLSAGWIFVKTILRR